MDNVWKHHVNFNWFYYESELSARLTQAIFRDDQVFQQIV